MVASNQSGCGTLDAAGRLTYRPLSPANAERLRGFVTRCLADNRYKYVNVSVSRKAAMTSDGGYLLPPWFSGCLDAERKQAKPKRRLTVWVPKISHAVEATSLADPSHVTRWIVSTNSDKVGAKAVADYMKERNARAGWVALDVRLMAGATKTWAVKFTYAPRDRWDEVTTAGDKAEGRKRFRAVGSPGPLAMPPDCTLQALHCMPGEPLEVTQQFAKPSGTFLGYPVYLRGDVPNVSDTTIKFGDLSSFHRRGQLA